MSLNFFGWPPWMILKLLTPILWKNDQSPTSFRFPFAKIIWHLSFRVLDITKDEWGYLVITSVKFNQNQWKSPLKYNIIRNTEQDITNTQIFLPRIFLENFNCHFNTDGCWCHFCNHTPQTLLPVRDEQNADHYPLTGKKLVFFYQGYSEIILLRHKVTDRTHSNELTKLCLSGSYCRVSCL